MTERISICCVGDLILDEPGPMEPYFAGSREVIGQQDVMIGHVETPHTRRNLPSCVDIQAPPSNPDHLEILAETGFDIATVAGNHLYDCGPYGVIDTVSGFCAAADGRCQSGCCTGVERGRYICPHEVQITTERK